MLWLYDSRNRGADGKQKRKLYKLPETKEGVWLAWHIVLDAEFDNPEERKDYYDLANCDDASCGLLNDYWAEYGWLLVPVDADDEIPHDAEEVVSYHAMQ